MDKPFCPQCEREYDPGVKFCQHDGAELIIRSEDTMSGEVFDGRYRVIHKIGEGGMGAVYKAQQISTGKNVAIKVVSKHLTENPATVRRFQREVKLQSKLEHPNIVTVIDFSQTKDGHYFFVMPFVEGKSLRRMILDDGKLSLTDFHDLASQMCDGLEYAHRRGIIHRDIKGDNIAIAQMEHQRVVKILDFGLAKAIQEDGSLKTGTELTQQGRVLGTPAYMSPEQAKGEIDKVGKPSDIYSLGVILYQMLSGKLPFESDTPWGVMHKHISEPPVPLRRKRPEVSQALEKVVMRCLEKDMGKRYQSALEVKNDLAKATAQPGGDLTKDPKLDEFEADIPEDKPAKSKTGIIALVIIMLAVSVWLWTQVNTTQEKDEKKLSATLTVTASNHEDNVEKTRLAEIERKKREVEEGKRKTEEKKKVPAGMVFVKGACFDMGDTFGNGRSDEKPVHRVCVDDFKMDKHEVTQADYQRVMGDNPSDFKNCGGDCPIEQVTWFEAKKYCEQVGKRLPTEAEWEYSARSGGKREKYAGENSVDSVGWHGSNSDEKTHRVGQKRPNGLGLYDMSGNVWEWVSDWYGDTYYGISSGRNPKGPSSGQSRVLRGGSWISYPDDLRASSRSRYLPGNRYSHYGFRCSQ